MAVSVLAIVVWMGTAAAAASPDTYTLEQTGWEQTSNPMDPASPAGELHHAQVAFAEGRHKVALELADAWIARHPDHPLVVDALFLRGDIKVALLWYYKALYDYEQVAQDHPACDRYAEALEREFEIAKLFTSGMKRRFLGMRILSALGDAEEIFIRIQERVPGSELGEKASWALGNFYYDRSQMTTAVEAYDLFLLNYPRSHHRESAMMRLIEASLATFRGPKFDPTGLIEARQRIKTFQQHYPAAAHRMDAESLGIRIDEMLALKTVHAARWYEQRHENVSAMTMYQKTVREYSHTAAGKTAVQRLRKMGAAVIPKRQVNNN